MFLFHTKKERRQNKNFGGNGCIYGIACSDVLQVYTYLRAHQIIYIKYVRSFVYQSCISRMVKKNYLGPCIKAIEQKLNRQKSSQRLRSIIPKSVQKIFTVRNRTLKI